MKILILGDADNPHIIKWSNGLASAGIEIAIFSLVDCAVNQLNPNIKVVTWKVCTAIKNSANGKWIKLYYIASLFKLKKFIRVFRPSIVHAHYASSYGFLGALTHFHPLVMSVWGADVFTFPRKSSLHEMLFKYNLSNADKVLSTSRIMANEIKKYTSKLIEITPFGIDSNVFHPGPKPDIENGQYDFMIGTIKGLEKQYGIEDLIETYCIVKEKVRSKVKLLIVGGGRQEEKLRNLVIKKNIQRDVIMTGRIDYSEVAKYHNSLDVYIALSISDDESFGVAILEASSTEKPVVVTNVGGLPELVCDGVSGFIVPPRNPILAAEKIIALLENKQLRDNFGKAGREKVINEYSWEKSLKIMLGIYREVTPELNREKK